MLWRPLDRPHEVRTRDIRLHRAGVALFLTVASGAACDRRVDRPRRDSVAVVARPTAETTTVTAARTTAPAPRPDTVVITSKADSTAPKQRSTADSTRFGIVGFRRTSDSSSFPCLAIEDDSLVAGTEVLLVAVRGDEHGAQRLGKAVTIGGRMDDCGEPSAMLGAGYPLRVTWGNVGNVGIIGRVDTLRLVNGRVSARFPGDTAHWRFETCTSMEGVHFVINRLSADSLLERWDGYYHVDYDLEPSCHGARDLPRAMEARARLAEWNGGKRGRETAMPLVIARWTRCYYRNEDDRDDTTSPVVMDSANYPAVLPEMAELLRAAGAPNELGTEDEFILGRLGRDSEQCIGSALPKPADSLIVDAARREPKSSLFRYFDPVAPARRPGAADIAAELHRRFDNRGEHYRMIREWLEEKTSRPDSLSRLN